MSSSQLAVTSVSLPLTCPLLGGVYSLGVWLRAAGTWSLAHGGRTAVEQSRSGTVGMLLAVLAVGTASCAAFPHSTMRRCRVKSWTGGMNRPCDAATRTARAVEGIRGWAAWSQSLVCGKFLQTDVCGRKRKIRFSWTQSQNGNPFPSRVHSIVQHTQRRVCHYLFKHFWWEWYIS